MSLAVGDPAPEFDLPASFGRSVSLAAMRGRPFALYFYPRADTPGCTKEACAFQAELTRPATLPVIGVSKDPMTAIEAFATKYGLDFPLASDPEGKVIAAYGAWVEKSMYGRTYMGTDRSTVLIDAQGRIARLWRKVKVPGHAAAVLEAARALG